MLTDALDAQSHASKRRLVLICREVFPGFDLMNAWEAARKMGNVEDVLGGLPVPTISRALRGAIEAAALRIPEEP